MSAGKPKIPVKYIHCVNHKNGGQFAAPLGITQITTMNMIYCEHQETGEKLAS
jgi:hypothetical protein